MNDAMTLRPTHVLLLCESLALPGGVEQAERGQGPPRTARAGG